MLTITEKQLDTMRKARFRRFALRVLEYVEEEGLGDLIPSKDPLAYTTNRLSWLREQTGVNSEQWLVELFVLFLKGGNSFEMRADVQKILAHSDLPPRSKYQRLKDLVNV